jgi:hypothetical protein
MDVAGLKPCPTWMFAGLKPCPTWMFAGLL